MKFRILNLSLLGVFLLAGNTFLGMRSGLADQPDPFDQPFEELEEETELELEEAESLIAGGLTNSIAAAFNIVVVHATEEVSLTLEPITHGPNCSRAPPRG